MRVRFHLLWRGLTSRSRLLPILEILSRTESSPSSSNYDGPEWILLFIPIQHLSNIFFHRVRHCIQSFRSIESELKDFWKREGYDEVVSSWRVLHVCGSLFEVGVCREFVCRWEERGKERKVGSGEGGATSGKRQQFRTGWEAARTFRNLETWRGQWTMIVTCNNNEEKKENRK